MGKITTGMLVGILAVLFGCKQPDLILTASEPVNVYSTLDDATSGVAIDFIALEKGEAATIVGCIDLKQYFVYQVKLSDRREGFVLAGKYSITREGLPAYCR